MNKTFSLIALAAALLSGCALFAPKPLPPVSEAAPEKVAPAYIMDSHRPGEQGTVRLQVLADGSGKPLRVFVLKTSGFPRLDQLAMDTVKTWHFPPAKLKGKPVEEWILVPIKFVYKP